MAVPAAPATNVRKPRAKRVVKDTVQVLYAKVLEYVNKFEKEKDKAKAMKMGEAIIDRESGDTQANRRDMIYLLKEARKWVSYEADQSQIKAAALAKYEALMAPVRAEWANALNAWTEWVKAENAKGHKGQLALAREGKFFAEFVHFEALVTNIKADPEAISTLVDELTNLTFAVQNFVWTKWCATCGAPVEEIVPRNGKKAFTPKLCGPCFHKSADEVPEAKPRKRVVKKPGSAGARHKGVAKKTKGALTTKELAVNAELAGEAIAHSGKPNMKGPAREKKAGKTKKNKGVGS